MIIVNNVCAIIETSGFKKYACDWDSVVIKKSEMQIS